MKSLTDNKDAVLKRELQKEDDKNYAKVVTEIEKIWNWWVYVRKRKLKDEED